MRVRGEQIRRRPESRVGDESREVRARSADAVGACPTQLVIEYLVHAVEVQHGLDDDRCEHGMIAGAYGQISQLIVVGQVVRDRFQAPDLLENRTPHADGRAEGVALSFDLPCHGDHRAEIRLLAGGELLADDAAAELGSKHVVNEPVLGDAAGDDLLADSVVEVVGSRVSEILALEVDRGPAEAIGQPVGRIEGVGPC